MDGAIVFQGERGAFGEDALHQHFGDAVEATAAPSFADVFEAVRDGAAAHGVVPIENSLHGSVLEVYDLLLAHELQVVAEVEVRVRHCLLALPGARIEQLVAVQSHPQALAQTGAFLREHGLEERASTNTARAARDVAAAGDPAVGAVASERAGALYGLEVLARDIQGSRRNVTRFVVLGRHGTPVRGATKATLVFTTSNEPGALHAALGCLAEHRINLTRLESRPTRDTPWEYHFYVDCGLADGGELTPARLERVTGELRSHAELVRVLGAYPAATPSRH